MTIFLICEGIKKVTCFSQDDPTRCQRFVYGSAMTLVSPLLCVGAVIDMLLGIILGIGAEIKKDKGLSQNAFITLSSTTTLPFSLPSNAFIYTINKNAPCDWATVENTIETTQGLAYKFLAQPCFNLAARCATKNCFSKIVVSRLLVIVGTVAAAIARVADFVLALLAMLPALVCCGKNQDLNEQFVRGIGITGVLGDIGGLFIRIVSPCPLMMKPDQSKNIRN